LCFAALKYGILWVKISSGEYLGGKNPTAMYLFRAWGIISPLSGGYNKEVENMKKVLCLAVVFTFVMSTAAPLYAADLPKPVDKLAKGTMDIVKSPLALYDHTKSEIDGADHKLLGFFKGAVTSPFHMVKKAGGGVMDVATFPIE
jgi:hypothetical protein